MAISFATTSYEGKIDAIWRGECEVLPGGFKLKNNLATGMLVKRGNPLYVDFDNMEAAVVKAVKVITGGSTSAPRVAKGHHFIVGDYVVKATSGTDTGVSITAINTSNAGYDVLTLSAAITGLAADDILQEADKTGSGAVPAYAPNAVVAADHVVDKNGVVVLDAAWGARVLKDKVDYPLVASWFTGICFTNNPNIVFIRQ